MGLYSKFTDGSQFSEEKKFVILLHGLEVTAIFVLQENSWAFLKYPVA